MTVKCTKKYKNNAKKDYITIGKEYYVIEIIYTRNTDNGDYKINYRIMDNNGVPAMYKVEFFEIIDSGLSDMVMCKKAYGYVITHKIIADSSLEREDVNGFWGVYFETENIIAKRILEEVIHKSCKNDNTVAE